MPCYLKEVEPLKNKLKKRTKVKSADGIPTKEELKAGLLEMLKAGEITPAKYNKLKSKIDACVEVENHTHEHDHAHGGW